MKKITLITALLIAVCLLAFASAADGAWSISGTAPNAPQHLTFSTSGTSLTGTLDGVAISTGSFSDNVIRFRATRGGTTYSYKGTVSGAKLALYEEGPTGQGQLYNYLHN